MLRSWVVLVTDDRHRRTTGTSQLDESAKILLEWKSQLRLALQIIATTPDAGFDEVTTIRQMGNHWSDADNGRISGGRAHVALFAAVQTNVGLRREASWDSGVTAHVSDQRRGRGSEMKVHGRLLVRQSGPERPIYPHLVVVDMDLAGQHGPFLAADGAPVTYRGIERFRESDPDVLVPIRPGLEVEDCVRRILGNFSQQFFNPLRFRLEHHVRGKRSVEVNLVQSFDAGGVLENEGIPGERIDEPRFASHVTGI